MHKTRNAFLTPETLTGEPLCYQISIPVHLFAYVLGALLPLGETWNWEQEGSVTPEDAAYYFSEWVYGILATECVQPMVVKRFEGTQDSVQSLANNSATKVNLSPSVWNSAYFSFDPSADEVTLTNDGHYVLTGGVGFAANATGRRGLWLSVDGSRVRGDIAPAAPTGVSAANVSYAKQLAAGTVVSLLAVQTSGGSLDTSVEATTGLHILYFGPEV